MRLVLRRLDVLGDHTGSVELTGGGVVTTGPLEVAITPSGAADRFTWSVANRGDVPVGVRGVRLVFAVDGVAGPLRLFRNGYQSWSPSAVATLGIDRDPSAIGDPARILRSTHHADEAPAAPGELRSEMVAVLADDRPGRVLVGFEGGRRHDGTLRLVPADPATAAGATAELAAEAFLGGAVLAPGQQRELHPVASTTGPDHEVLLERWAARYGQVEQARVDAHFQVGWCSWYHYYGFVTEGDLRSNLDRSSEWPFEVFQLDDGYQATIGDWTRTNDKFPSDLDDLATAIAAEGRRPGLWLAPFLVRPDATVAVTDPDWIAQVRPGKPLIGMWHPVWGGEALTLDTSNPEVVAHLTDTAREIVDAGFTYLKLDFTYAPAADGVYADPSLTPAERVRAGYDAIRAGAGDDTFLLGCGAPLGAVVGVVDGMRIGADVDPSWALAPERRRAPGYDQGEPATAHAWCNTLTRSFLHRNLWLNDPDCVMLRSEATSLTADAARTWAHAVGVSGGMVLVSDDLGLLGGDARHLLDEVIALGRASDAAAIVGRPARCPDLLDHAVPGTLVAEGATLVADPAVPTSTLTPG